jgi:hypothetical protein
MLPRFNDGEISILVSTIAYALAVVDIFTAISGLELQLDKVKLSLSEEIFRYSRDMNGQLLSLRDEVGILKTSLNNTESRIQQQLASREVSLTWKFFRCQFSAVKCIIRRLRCSPDKALQKLGRAARGGLSMNGEKAIFFWLPESKVVGPRVCDLQSDKAPCKTLDDKEYQLCDPDNQCYWQTL